MSDAALLEFQRLCEKRECAAYQAAGAIKTALAFLSQGDSQQALNVLQFARAEYDQADSRITEFLNSKKETTHNGNSTANAA
jgi:replication-associated recombination protein RarA